MQRANRLEWVTIGSMLLIVVGVYSVMGNSQAMKAAWVEDLLSLVAPIAFLISARFRKRAPNAEFPYGYHRSVSIAFLCGAVALTIFGLLIVCDSMLKLILSEHASIGASVLFGHVIWSGWLMMAMLFISAIPPLVLGRMKLKLAKKLHDKTLKADADMNKADWITALAGMVGIAGIAFGLWWADAAAGIFISGGIVKDGVQNLRGAVSNLMDGRPVTVQGERSMVPKLVRDALSSLPWVIEAEVRMREEGHVFTGELFLRTDDCSDLSAKTAEAKSVAQQVDWRVHDFVVEFEVES